MGKDRANVSLKNQFHCELQISGIRCSTSLTECRIIDRIVSYLEVGVIEYIEGFGAELKPKWFEKPESFEDGYIRGPVSRPDEGIAPQVTHAGKAGLREEILRQIESLCPLGESSIDMICYGIWPVIRYPIEIVVSSHDRTICGIEGVC